MRRLPLLSRLKLYHRYPIFAIDRNMSMGLLILFLFAAILWEKAFSQPLPLKNYAEIKGETFNPDAGLIEEAEKLLQDEKEENLNDGLVIVQTNIDQIEVKSNVRERITKFGSLKSRANILWYLIPCGQQNLYFKTNFSCPFIARIDECDEKKPIFYYRLWGVESKIKLDMIYIPSGEMAGSEQFDDETAEKNFRRVAKIDNFCMSKTEVTNAQFCEFLKDKTEAEIGQFLELDNEFCLIKKKDGIYVPKAGFGNYPVVTVSWEGAKAFCDWLREKGGKRYRLPTAEEWEWAAQGAAHRYQNHISITGNFHGRNDSFDQWPKLAPVDELPADALGLKGIWGNVWEWCGEVTLDGNWSAKNRLDSTGSRIIRGGSWLFTLEQIRASNLERVKPGLRSFAVGFRVVKPYRE